MADEITVNIRLAVEKGSLSIDKNPGNFSADMAGSKYLAKVVAVPHTTEAQIFESDDIGTEGFFYLRNVGTTTEFVTVGVKPAATFYPVMKLLPGESNLIRLAPGVDLYGLANGAADVNLEYVAVEA